MCGIIGIVSKGERIFELLVTGLMTLQHRGQDSCGIITCEKAKFFIKKGMDAVHRVYKLEDKNSLMGNMGIGHTRYPTQGRCVIEDAQPLLSLTNPKISMAHNGNITNYFNLQNDLEKESVELKTSVDCEVVLNIFAKSYEKNKDFFEAAQDVIKRVRGSYSIIGIIEGKGIFAIRDAFGFRPLVLGKRGHSYALSSETVSFQTMEYEYVKDIKPAEALFISNNLEVKSKIFSHKKRAHCMFEWIYFASPNSMIEGRSVYKARLALGKMMAKYLDKKDIHEVIPVPDSGRTAAIKLSEELGVKYREGLIKDKYINRTFIMPCQKTRRDSVKRKL